MRRLPIVGLTLLICVSSRGVGQSALAQGAGWCRSAECAPACAAAEKAWADYARKEQVVKDIYDGWLKTDREIRQQFADDLKEIVLGTVESPTAHVTGDAALEYQLKRVKDGISNEFLKQARHADAWGQSRLMNDAAAAQRAATKAAAAAEAVTLAVFVMEIQMDSYNFFTALHNAQKAEAENNKGRRRAEELWKDALDDLKQSLAAEPQCRNEMEKVRAKEKLLDQAKAMLAGWEQNENGVLYKDPTDPNGPALDYAAALKRAMQVLTRQSGTLLLPGEVRLVAFAPPAPQQSEEPLARQLQDAWVQIRLAHQLFMSIADSAINHARARINFAQALQQVRQSM